MRDLVSGLPDAVPEGTEIIGSYQTGHDVLNQKPLPSVMIVEANDTSGLAFINAYYNGYLQFQWTPVNAIGATRSEREARQTQATELAAAARAT